MKTTILGIDPGSRITGYGIIKVQGNQISYQTSGSIKLKNIEISSRLHDIFKEISYISEYHQIEEVAIEEVFFYKNPSVALKLGHARGAAIVGALSGGNCQIFEYSPRQVKQSLVGYGAAEKKQVQHMVMQILNLSGDIQVDSADALAIALCHAFSRNQLAIQQKFSIKTRRRRRAP